MTRTEVPPDLKRRRIGYRLVEKVLANVGRQSRRLVSLCTFISPEGGETPAHLLQDAWFSMGTFDAGQEITYRLNKKNTGVYIFVLEGSINVQDVPLSRRDGIGVWEVEETLIRSVSGSSVLAIEVPVE